MSTPRLIEDHYLPKVLRQLERAPERFPHVTEGGRWTTSETGLWTGGFWVGQLWLLWQATGEPKIRAALTPLLERLRPRKDAAEIDFDLGFLYTYAFVLGHRLTGDEGLRATALEAADRLMTLAEPKSGLIVHRYPERAAAHGAGTLSTLIDVMMNLPLLWWAAEATELTDATASAGYRAVAEAHARTSLAWLLRPDGTTAQLADVDPETGACLRLGTINGQASESCWARGQAWAVYGFLQAARATGDAGFQDAFARTLRAFAERLPADGLPPWDFNAPEASRSVVDSSAAAIVLAALRRAKAVGVLPGWAEALEQRLHACLLSCLAPEDRDGVLAQSCHRYHLGSGVGGASIWGDYFYLESLTGEAPY